MATTNEIRSAIKTDPENKWATDQGWEPLFSAHQDAKIVIIGQAPGRLAQESGIPWDDPSGRNLRSWMGVSNDVFYDETKVAIIPMDFYFPGAGKSGDIPPRPEFAAKWHEQLLENLTGLTLTLLIGQYAQKYYLGDKAKRTLTDTVRAFDEFLPEYLPLVHPSPRNNIWQKRNPWFAQDLLPQLKTIVADSL